MDKAFRFAENIKENAGSGFPNDAFERMKDCCGQGHFGTDFFSTMMYPPANIYLTPEKNLVFEIALTGFDEKDISIQFKGDSLVLSAKAPASDGPDANSQYFKRRLRMKDIIEQRFYVPADRFDQSATQATFKNGLLKIVVPAREQGDKGPEIKVDIHPEG